MPCICSKEVLIPKEDPITGLTWNESEDSDFDIRNKGNKCRYFKVSKAVGWFKPKIDITHQFKKKLCKDCDYFYCYTEQGHDH